jgi:phosphatidylinositol alpha-1,6-mannosyltransferase
MFRQNYSRAEHIIAVSNFVKKKIVEYGADPDNIAVITNGVDVNLFRPRPHREARDKLGLPPESFIVLFSGNLIPRKGVDVLIQAFSRCVERYPDARLVVVGVGDEEERLTDLVAELGVTSQVIFTGYRPFTEMPLWYQACDVFVMPSWAEGLSMAILEAMASGRPVITSRPEVGEHDAVIQGETGLLVEYGNVEKLALILDRLMSSPQMVRRLGHGARKMAMATFTWDLIGRRTAEVYRVAMRQARQG